MMFLSGTLDYNLPVFLWGSGATVVEYGKDSRTNGHQGKEDTREDLGCDRRNLPMFDVSEKRLMSSRTERKQ